MDASLLKGDALDAAARAAGVSLSGTAEEKREAIASYLEQNPDDEPRVAEAANEVQRAKATAGQTEVAVAFPVDSLDTKIDGVGELTQYPKPVRDDQLGEIREAAKSAAVALVIDGEREEPVR